MSPYLSYLFLALLILFSQMGFSIPNHKYNRENDSISANKPTINEMDSMLVNWYAKYPVSIQANRDYSAGDSLRQISERTNTDYPDSVYINRISQIPSVIPLSYNKIVKAFIEVYTVKKRDKMEAILGKIDHYFPLFEEILDYYGLPIELKYLPVIESALTPGAVSRAGATGLWQFMYGTGRLYKLEINSFVDERRDPIKSSHAAAQYLRDLYNIYQDWILVIAAYNCGPGNVNKAIRRTGGKRNYWEIYYYLPRETRGYVPAFIAATYTINYYKKHDLMPAVIEYSKISDTITITEDLHFQQVSNVLNIPVETIRQLNPQYRRDIVPASNKSYSLKLPLEHVGQFIEYQDSIFAYQDSVYFNPENMNAKPSYYSRYSPVTPKNKAKLYYTVKPGDNLGYIAEWYHVRASDLRYWNNIRGSLIRTGQKLVIFVPKNQEEYFKAVNALTFEEKQKRIGAIPTISNSNQEGTYHYYTVKYGDTLWDIARKYPGVTDDQIMHWNNIPNAASLKVGQKIKIKTYSN